MTKNNNKSDAAPTVSAETTSTAESAPAAGIILRDQHLRLGEIEDAIYSLLLDRLKVLSPQLAELFENYVGIASSNVPDAMPVQASFAFESASRALEICRQMVMDKALAEHRTKN